MDTEKKVQSAIIKYLRSKGCWIMKTTPGMGVPTGTPDVFFCKEGFYGFIECKKSKTAKWQPLQKETLQKFADWSYGRAIYPENYQEIIDELESLL